MPPSWARRACRASSSAAARAAKARTAARRPLRGILISGQTMPPGGPEHPPTQAPPAYPTLNTRV